MSKTVLFQAIQFSKSSDKSSGSDGNEGVLRISKISNISWTSPSDCLVSYPGHFLGESYPSAEMQSMYTTAPADWATKHYSIEIQ